MRRAIATGLIWAILLTALAAPALADGVSAQILLGDEAQTHNALLAANAIDGLVLSFGGSFSFNELVGPRTEERGFISARNGRGVEVTGGGVAQAASALYLALLNLEDGSVSFDELAFYGDRYTGSYVPDGSQAIMVDYSANRDFRFTSYYPGSMILTFEQTDDALVCQIILDVEFEFFDSGTEAPSFAETMTPRSATSSASVSLLCDGDDAALSNISLAADSIYDLTLAPGDIFSFNAVVGPLEARYGYREADNGRGEQVMGGGVAQVASALWLLVQNLPDVAIIEKTTYGSAYCQSYVANSSDAIFVDYNTGIDFSFRYTGDDYLTLYIHLQDTTLTADCVWTGSANCRRDSAAR